MDLAVAVRNARSLKPSSRFSTSLRESFRRVDPVTRRGTSWRRFPAERTRRRRRRGRNARLNFKGEPCCTQTCVIHGGTKETSRTISDAMRMVLSQILCTGQRVMHHATRETCQLKKGRSNLWRVSPFPPLPLKFHMLRLFRIASASVIIVKPFCSTNLQFLMFIGYLFVYEWLCN